jgi:DNA-binding transcriptional MerR regulator
LTLTLREAVVCLRGHEILPGKEGTIATTISAALTVGELARQTGVSVRTLHHYDEIGLLSPSGRSEAGYRLYREAEVARLQQIVSLKQMGFSLTEIKECLTRPDFSLRRVIELHLIQLREQTAAQLRLCERLEAFARSLDSAEHVSLEDLLETIKEMNKVEKYYTPEQLDELRKRAGVVGEERMRQVGGEWAELMAAVRAEMDQGTDPASEPVQRLAQKWQSLINEFTGGNPGIERSLRNLYQNESTVHGMDTAPMRELGDYIGKALASHFSVC